MQFTTLGDSLSSENEALAVQCRWVVLEHWAYVPNTLATLGSDHQILIQRIFISLKMYTEKNAEDVNSLCSLIEEYKNHRKVPPKINNKIYNKAKFIIDHDRWFSQKVREMIYEKVSRLQFITKKQKATLGYSSLGGSLYDDDYCYDDGANSDEDRRWCD